MRNPTESWLNTYLTKIRKFLIYGASLTFLSACCYTVFAYCISIFLDEWLKGDPPHELLCYATLAALVKAGLSYFANVINNEGAEQVVKEVRTSFLSASLSDHELKPTEGVQLYTYSLDDLKPFYSQFIPTGIASIVVSALLILVFFLTDKIVAVILLISLLLIPLQMIAVGFGAESIHQKNLQVLLRYSSIFYNRIQSLASIRNIGKVEEQSAYIKEKSTEVNEANMKVMKVAMLSSTLMEFFITFSIAIVAIYLGLSLLDYLPFQLKSTGYPFRNAMFLLMLTPFYYLYLRRFVAAYHDRNQAMAVADRIRPILNNENFLSRKKENNRLLPSQFVNIRIQGLHFSYDTDGHEVLDNINCVLPKKGLIWLNGISGSGKSTLLKLLSGYLNDNTGSILVDELNPEDSRAWLSENTAYFNQHTFIFEDSIRKNIEMNVPLSDAQLLEALSISGFFQVMEKNRLTLDSRLHNNGIQLSGGEKQLLGFARLIAHEKPVFLLDEPTANLDKHTELVFHQKLKDLSTHRLIIIASHQTGIKGYCDLEISLSLGQQMNKA